MVQKLHQTLLLKHSTAAGICKYILRLINNSFQMVDAMLLLLRCKVERPSTTIWWCHGVFL